MIRELLSDPIVIALLVLIGVIAGTWFGWYLRGTTIPRDVPDRWL